MGKKEISNCDWEKRNIKIAHMIEKAIILLEYFSTIRNVIDYTYLGTMTHLRILIGARRSDEPWEALGWRRATVFFGVRRARVTLIHPMLQGSSHNCSQQRLHDGYCLGTFSMRRDHCFVWLPKTLL